ncbi:MAG: hypothetical protein M1360_00895 [Candidatus Marsarchaeota archaeon]|jgi:hypothetical protein|nr:hypothetical protein [Candidatus Marsarchaeota archaeon]MCL5418483.1 hypothetical protein [Candidatus Marsarchaeota archaeon]
MVMLVIAMLALAHLSAALPISMPLLGLLYTPLTWLPIAFVAVLVVILVAAIVYMLANIIMSANAKAWARMQIYEAFLSIVMILVFGAFSYLFFISPQAAFGPKGLNIVPQGSGVDVLGFSVLQQGCTSATDIFQLSVCDLSLFNGVAGSMAEFAYYVSYLTGIVPTLSIKIGIPDYPEENLNVGFATSLLPGEIDNLLPVVYSGIMFALLISQLQLLILSGSLLFLSVFLTLGLVMRTFGFTRTFGGAMIAFGLGLGLVFPLLTSITYGFIDTNIVSTCLGTSACGQVYMLGTVLSMVFTYATGAGVNLSLLTGGVKVFGYILAGLTFIPFLNFTIVDAFIVDFSRSIGERMDFMSLLSNII